MHEGLKDCNLFSLPPCSKIAVATLGEGPWVISLGSLGENAGLFWSDSSLEVVFLKMVMHHCVLEMELV